MRSHFRSTATLLLAALLSSTVYAQDGGKVQDDLTEAGIKAYFPGQDGYLNASQPFNLRFTPEPVAVAYPTTALQVSEIVKIGHRAGIPVTARSGGHSYIAAGLGSQSHENLVIDLSHLNTITYNESTHIAVIGPGNRLGPVAVKLNEHGRGIPHGSCAYVGIGGHAAFAGYGFASRMWGLTIDTILSVEAVLANGTITTASETQHPDLFWALRGAAPSFGLITSYTIQTFPVPSSGLIFSYAWTFNTTYAATAILHLQSRIRTLPILGEFSCQIVLTPGPVVGEINLSLSGGWYGPPDELDSVIAPFLEDLPPRRDESVGGGSWIESVENLAGGSLDTSAPGGTDVFYAKSLILTQESGGFTNESALAFARYLANEGKEWGSFWFLQVELYGGPNSAIADVPGNATAFAWRDALFTIQLYVSSPGQGVPYPDAGVDLFNGMADSITDNSPEGTVFGAYTNYVEDQLEDWQTRYYSDHYPRLQQIKKEVDPDNTFRFLTSVELPRDVIY
ncbi:glucooligosaccharide oxidase [Pterulicium gracile]|uniref:Glucooligosaccharide oxidase n=1 Tax=Pterulicium gracile TaxID=1884261 RepID=A0A5C3Q705_9AGAR|nr:glucooligosaccharide oxidase [Pterula gracilis]